MNLRPAAALALVGWYLMVPPTGRDYSMGNVGVPRTPEDNYWLSPGAADAYARAATRRGDPGARGRQVGEVRRTSRSHLETVFGGGGSLYVLRPSHQFVRGSQRARPKTAVIPGWIAADAGGVVATHPWGNRIP